MKFCKDCKHVEVDHNDSYEFAKCARITGKTVDLVSGEVTETKSEIDFCSIHRDDNWIDAVMLGTCGKRGRFFEPKEQDLESK